MAISITNLSGGNTPADGSDPRTFPAIWNATATDLEGVATDLDALEATVGAHDLNSLSGVGITTPVEGDLLTYNGTSWVNGVPAGSILQVVSTTKTDTYSESIAGRTISSNIVTGLTAEITPVSTSSRIRVDISTGLSNSGENGSGGFVIRRGSTAIGVGATAGDRASVSAYGGAVLNSVADMAMISLTFVDSPSSTSALTYGISVYNRDATSATAYVNRSSSDTDDGGRARTVSTITLTEVAG
jgi:hypothetical protein